MSAKTILLFRSKTDDASNEDVYEKVRSYSTNCFVLIIVYFSC